MSQTAAEGRASALSRWLRKAAGLALTVGVTFLGLLLVTFFISHVVSVDPVLAAVGDRASQATYDKMFLEMGLDKPLWEQFWIYLQKILSGDLGTSFLTKKLIVEDIARVFPATLELATGPVHLPMRDIYHGVAFPPQPPVGPTAP